MRVIDLTHPIHSGMPTYPVAWHPYVEVTQLGRLGIEKRESRRIVMGTHSGTHVDAPSHFVPGGASIDEIPLELLSGPAGMLDLRHCGEKEEVGVEFFRQHLAEKCPARLILRFGWSNRWGALDYYTHNPFLSQEAGQWLIDRGVRMLGMDVPQVDSPDHGRGCDKDSPLHKIMLGQGCYFVENLTNLDQLDQMEFEWVVSPLKIVDGDGGPCRTYAVLRGAA